jgi:hypothetical protein
MLSLKKVGDDDLLQRLSGLVKQSRRVEADVVLHIGEVEARRLFAREGCPSMFDYCQRVLGLRENEAYLRLTVARAARATPILLEMLRDGRLHLSGIARLSPHLRPDNCEAVLKRAAGLSHRGIRELVAELDPKPDVASAIRKLPDPPASGRAASGSGPLELGAPRGESAGLKVQAVKAGGGSEEADGPGSAGPFSWQASPAGQGTPPGEETLEGETDGATGGVHEQAGPLRGSGSGTGCQPCRGGPRPTVEPLAPARYKVTFTASAELREKLEQLQALMRAAVPDGDLARIIDIAVTEKLERVESRRFAKTAAPRKQLADTDTGASSRHIPAAVRRTVHERDGGRCVYRDRHGRRCGKHHDLEFHHKKPFARGGDHSPGNLVLMCRAHNTLLAEHDYGEEVMARFRASSKQTAPGGAAVPVDAYGARITVQPRWRSPG